MEEIINNSKKVERMLSFNDRWNIKLNEDKNKLKTRCLNVLLNDINSVIKSSSHPFEFTKNLDNDISTVLGISSGNGSSYFENLHSTLFVSKLNLNVEYEYITFIKYLEEIINSSSILINNERIAKKISEAFKLSNANLKILKDNDVYIIIPGNNELLDNDLVIDNLRWLNDYKDCKELLLRAITTDRCDSNYRSIIDDLRLSLELFFKQLFNNKKSLENQKDNIGNYLKDNSVSKEISNMYIKLFNYYTCFNNDNAKHGNDIKGIEIDYLIYLNGTFIYLIKQIEDGKREVVKS